MTRVVSTDRGVSAGGVRQAPSIPDSEGEAAAEQVAALRRLTRLPAAPRTEPKRSAMTVAVTSGKGGVGKTNLAVNLAVCLQARGLQTTLVDVDMGLANADVLLGVQPRRSLREVMAGRCALTDVAVVAANGLSFIAAPSGGEGVSRIDDRARAKLADELTFLPGEVVIFDCSAGIAPSVTTFARAADVVLVVTTAEPTALTDAYATVKTLLREGYDGSLRLVVNMVESRSEAKGAFERICGVCEKFMKCPIADAGYLLHDTHVELAVRQRVPFVVRYPRSPASVCTLAVAARLVSGSAALKGEAGLWQRVAGMFL